MVFIILVPALATEANAASAVFMKAQWLSTLPAARRGVEELDQAQPNTVFSKHINSFSNDRRTSHVRRGREIPKNIIL